MNIRDRGSEVRIAKMHPGNEKDDASIDLYVPSRKP